MFGLLRPARLHSVRRRPHRSSAFASAATGVAVVLALGLLPSSAAAPAGLRRDHVAVPGPTNAQTSYNWGKPQWQDDFVGPLKSIWKVKGRGVVQNQVGMLTLNTTSRRSVSATLTGHAHRVGRWEIRLRQRRYSTAHENFSVVTELIPAGNRRQNCGARNISLETFRLGSNTAKFYVRNRPDVQFTARRRLNLGTDRWHTFAVEVTPKRISWIVDSHVVAQERRDAALSGALFTVRFKMLAVPGARMNPSRMQMDWLRYFTLERKNRPALVGPRATKGTYGKAC